MCREDEEALLREVVERPPQLSPRQWVESCGGLVEEGDLGVRGECGGHQDLPPLPAGEASVQLSPLIVKSHPPDRLRPSPSGLRVADSPPQQVGDDGLERGHPGDRPRFLGDRRNPLPQLLRFLDDVDPVNLSGPRGRLELGSEDSH